MRKKAVLYARVSTHEQKIKGFGLNDQIRSLKAYCLQNDIEVVKIYGEDVPATSFDRPLYQEFYRELKKGTIKCDLFIVTKHDRFSRVASQVPTEVKKLNSCGVSVWVLNSGVIDYEDANKFWTNYINAGAAQHDNIVRADNTIRGMRQAQREGRWMGKAPIGYKNNIYTKICEPDEKMSKCNYSGTKVNKNTKGS